MATATPAPIGSTAPTHYAGFWIRFVAAFIDGIVVGCANALISIIFGFGGMAMTTTTDPIAALPLILASAAKSILIGTALSWLYHAFLESSEKQATLGKMVVGIKVTDLNMQRISFGKATARFFFKYVSALILFIGYIMAGFTAKKQALHDMIVGTLVVYK